ncbi:targeting protein for Xklp2-like isoform X3 [Pristis pectinata]|nr:targeting protein for Xklp2-like isoform X3 [Pristis pectinata]XP_051882988.1 targeting protein for Xklp2-like isoform X3 [Pristis pectinata]
MDHNAKIILPLNPGEHRVPTAVVNPILRIEGNSDTENAVTSAGSDTPIVSLSFTSWAETTDNAFSPLGHAAQSPGLTESEDVSNSAGGTTTPRLGNREEFVIHRRPRLTRPKTPMVLKRCSMNQRPMSSEEQELLLISQLQRAMVKRRKFNEAMMHLSIFARGCSITRSLVPATDTRPKTISRRVQAEYKEYNFVNELRKYPPSTPINRVCTVPKPFSLSTSAKRNHEKVPVKQYISVAEYINIFQHYTQPGSHRRPRCQEIATTALNSQQAPVPSDF